MSSWGERGFNIFLSFQTLYLSYYSSNTLSVKTRFLFISTRRHWYRNNEVPLKNSNRCKTGRPGYISAGTEMLYDFIMTLILRCWTDYNAEFLAEFSYLLISQISLKH